MRTNIAAYTESGPITRNVVQYISISEEADNVVVSVRNREGQLVEVTLSAEDMLALSNKLHAWFHPHG